MIWVIKLGTFLEYWLRASFVFAGTSSSWLFTKRTRAKIWNRERALLYSLFFYVFHRCSISSVRFEHSRVSNTMFKIEWIDLYQSIYNKLVPSNHLFSNKSSSFFLAIFYARNIEELYSVDAVRSSMIWVIKLGTFSKYWLRVLFRIRRNIILLTFTKTNKSEDLE